MNIGRSSGLQKMTVAGTTSPAVDLRTSAIAFIRSTVGGSFAVLGAGTDGEQEGATYSPINDELGAAIGLTLVANEWCMIPEKLGAFAGFIKIDFGGDQTGAVVELALKG